MSYYKFTKQWGLSYAKTIHILKELADRAKWP
jgi:hypothetical protein